MLGAAGLFALFMPDALLPAQARHHHETAVHPRQGRHVAPQLLELRHGEHVLLPVAPALLDVLERDVGRHAPGGGPHGGDQILRGVFQEGLHPQGGLREDREGSGRQGLHGGLASEKLVVGSDQLFHVKVEIPTKLSSKQKELLEEFAKESGYTKDTEGEGFLDKMKTFFE